MVGPIAVQVVNGRGLVWSVDGARVLLLSCSAALGQMLHCFSFLWPSVVCTQQVQHPTPHCVKSTQTPAAASPLLPLCCCPFVPARALADASCSSQMCCSFGGTSG